MSKLLKASDILNIVYNAPGECAYTRFWKDKPDIQYNKDVKELFMYSNDLKTRKHCQHYKRQCI
eukprot:7170984-Ditylum_brightwellii.AAC.1